MNTLSDYDLEVIQRAIDRRLDLIRPLGLSVETSADLMRWVEHMQAAPGVTRISANLDPRRGNVGPWNTYFVYCQDETGGIVATMVEKLYQIDDLLHEIRTHNFFHDGAPRLQHYTVALTEDALALPRIFGKVSYGGGLWVHPDWRSRNRGSGIRLGDLLPQIGRFLNIRKWNIDAHVSMIKSSPDRSKWSREGVGNAWQIPLIVGRYPDDDRELNVSLHFNTRDDILGQIMAETDLEDRRVSRTVG